jgi:hypothetical protein
LSGEEIKAAAGLVSRFFAEKRIERLESLYPYIGRTYSTPLGTLRLPQTESDKSLWVVYDHPELEGAFQVIFQPQNRISRVRMKADSLHEEFSPITHDRGQNTISEKVLHSADPLIVRPHLEYLAGIRKSPFGSTIDELKEAESRRGLAEDERVPDEVLQRLYEQIDSETRQEEEQAAEGIIDLMVNVEEGNYPQSPPTARIEVPQISRRDLVFLPGGKELHTEAQRSRRRRAPVEDPQIRLL